MIAPWEIKFSLELRDVPIHSDSTNFAVQFKAPTSSALEMISVTEQETNSIRSNEHGVLIGSDTQKGQLSWTDQILVDDVSEPISIGAIGPVSGLDENEFYLGFPRGSKVSWDPTIGVTGMIDYTADGRTPLTIDWISLAIGAIIGIAVGSVVGYLIKGKPHNKTGHVTLNRREVKPSSPGSNVTEGETETLPTTDDQKTKDKSKKDYVGHVTLMK
jgi:hypothetical protein